MSNKSSINLYKTIGPGILFASTAIGVSHLVQSTKAGALFGFGLLVGKFFTDEPLLKKMLGNSLSLTDEGWKVLNSRWVYFFFGLALLNEIIWRTQSEEFWVNFKVWGILPITIIFTAFQLSVITKFKLNE